MIPQQQLANKYFKTGVGWVNRGSKSVFIATEEIPVYADIRAYLWEPGVDPPPKPFDPETGDGERLVYQLQSNGQIYEATAQVKPAEDVGQEFRDPDNPGTNFAQSEGWAIAINKPVQKVTTLTAVYSYWDPDSSKTVLMYPEDLSPDQRRPIQTMSALTLRPAQPVAPEEPQPQPQPQPQPPAPAPSVSEPPAALTLEDRVSRLETAATKFWGLGWKFYGESWSSFQNK